MPSRSAPRLAVIGSSPTSTAPAPPPQLGDIGAELWADIVAEYEFEDRGSYETLAQACAAADRAERCRRQIDQDGELIQTNTGVRDHPLLKHELAARAFVVRTLARLGLDLEPVRAGPGRPTGARGG
jgi:hypothetical protein